MFYEHPGGICKYCRLFAGYYSLPNDEYKIASRERIEGNKEDQSKYSLHVELALVQLFFDIFIVQTKREFLEISLQTVCRFLVSKKIDARLVSAFILYLDFVGEKDQSMIQLLLAIDFFEYFSDYISEFMQNFELMSFKDAMAHKFEGNLEAMIQQDNKLEIKSIMLPLDKRKQKANRTINLKAGKEIDETVIDFQKKVYYNDCIWDERAKRFRFEKILLSPQNWKRIQDFNTDFEYGYYTYYFWRLHSMHHLLAIWSGLLAKLKPKARKGVMKRIGHLPLQVIEISVMFKDYSQLFVPRAPFTVESECWNEIKGMASEFLVLYC